MLTEKLLAIDPIIIGIYLAVSLLLGIFGSRLLGMNNSKEEDYYLAGRKMPGWLNGMSVAATALNSDVAPLYCGIAVVTGLSGCWFFLSRFGMALLLAAILFAVRWRQMGIRTGPEFFHLRFGAGNRFARVYSSLTSVLIGMVPWIGAGLIGIHLVAAPIFGIDSKAVTLLIVLPLLTIYVWTSGLAGVLLTDALQGFVILAANLVMVGAVLWVFGGPSGLAEAVMSAAGPENGAAILSVLPQADNPVLSPLSIFAWMVIVSVGAGSAVGADGQRLFSCRSSHEAAKVGIWGEVILFAMLLMLMLPAMGLLARHPEFYTATPTEREFAYGRMLSEFLPKGGVGLTVAALLAAVMSTISTHLNYGSQTLLNDVWRPLVGEPKPGREVWIGRLLMLGIAVLSVGVVFAADSLLGIAVVVLGIFGTSAAFGWAQWWYWRINFKGWCASVVAGPLVYLVCGRLLPLIPWWAAEIARGPAEAQNMQLLQAVVALAVNTAIWLTVTLLTRPEDMEVLKEFYLRARPMGCWGPVRRALIAEGRLPAEAAPSLILPGISVAAVGFAMVAAGVLTASTLYVGQYREAGLCGAVCLGTGAVFKLIFNRYISRLTVNQEP